MTLKDLKNEIDFFTGELSTQIRTLCYCGFAVIWMLKDGSHADIGFPKMLLWAMLFLFLTLVLDIIFLIYSYLVANKTFNEKELIINENIRKRKKGNIEDIDLGGWSRCYTCKKQWLRCFKILTCLLGWGFIIYQVLINIL